MSVHECLLSFTVNNIKLLTQVALSCALLLAYGSLKHMLCMYTVLQQCCVLINYITHTALAANYV